jgi:hypothetical protein
MSVNTPKKHYGGSEGMAPFILNLALDVGKWSASRSDRFTFCESVLDTQSGGWVVPRANLNTGEWKYLCTCSKTNNDSTVIQPMT